MNAARRPTRSLLLITFAAAAAASAQTSTPAPNPAPVQTSPSDSPNPAIDPAIAPTVIHHPKPRLPPIPTTTNLNLIVIDPGHGAADNGAMFPGNTAEKDVTLALANRLADALRAKGFTVVLTRTNSTDDVPTDARVELANRSRPLACILLHAANGGHGVHLYTSALTPPNYADPNIIMPWDTAQSTALPQSARLTNDLATALNGIRVPLVTARASVRPIDSLTCPAVAVEIAPISANGDINTPVTDANYQARVAEALATALVFWRGHADSNSAAAAATGSQSAAKTAPAAVPPVPKAKPKPKPAPAATPDGSAPIPAPAAQVPAAKTPAPIIRVPPPADPGAPPPQ